MNNKENINALREKIIKDKEMRGNVMKVTAGAFGDISEKDCTGLVEDIIRCKNGKWESLFGMKFADYPIPADKEKIEGDVFTKFYGCSYLFKGNPAKDITRNIGMGKIMISGILREIIMQSFLLKSALFLMCVLARKRFYHYLWVYSKLINANATAELKKNRLNAPIRELKRAMDIAIEKEMKREGIRSLTGDYFHRRGDSCIIMANVSEFTFCFLQNDAAYRFPLQDIFEKLNKINLSRGFYSELNRLFSILIKRTVGHEYMSRKWVYLRRMCLIGLFLFPPFKRIIKDFMLELDVDNVKLDDSDWYFCLQKQFYEYRGVSLEDRIKEKERIDEEKGHILLEFSRVE